MRIERFLTAFAISAAMIGPSAAADCDVSMLDQLDRFDKEVMYDFVPYSILIQAERTVIFSACYGKAQNGSAEAQYMMGFLLIRPEGHGQRCHEMVQEVCRAGISSRTESSRLAVL